MGVNKFNRFSLFVQEYHNSSIFAYYHNDNECKNDNESEPFLKKGGKNHALKK